MNLSIYQLHKITCLCYGCQLFTNIIFFIQNVVFRGGDLHSHEDVSRSWPNHQYVETGWHCIVLEARHAGIPDRSCMANTKTVVYTAVHAIFKNINVKIPSKIVYYEKYYIWRG